MPDLSASVPRYHDSVDHLRYPIGRFEKPHDLTDTDREKAISDIESLPGRLSASVKGWGDDRLDTPYRPEGWTVRQVLHHVADSHMTSYLRFKLALTEQEPTIKPYDEAAWAKLADATAPVQTSLDLLDLLHQRWVLLLRSLQPAEWQRTFRHPERGLVRLDTNLMLYSWHGRHHLSHITSLSERMGW
jgi:DinB superfamily